MKAFAAAVIILMIMAAGNYLYERLLLPVEAGAGGKLSAVLYLPKDTDVENTIDGILWLIQTGRLKADIIVVDAGIGFETEKRIRLMMRDNPNISLCRIDELEEMISK